VFSEFPNDLSHMNETIMYVFLIGTIYICSEGTAEDSVER
jgi:hypothetical protein